MPRLTHLLGALLSLSACVLSQSVTPSNTTTYVSTANNASRVVLALTSPPAWVYINPLTPEAVSILPNDTNTVGNIFGSLAYAGARSIGNFFPSEIAYLSCDPSSYQGYVGLSSVVESAIAANVTAIVFFSETSDYCALNGSYDFPRLYTMYDVVLSQRLLQRILNNYAGPTFGARAYILTKYAYDNVMSSGPTSTPAVAMVILYSVTGVISALFLAVIVSGTLRAHRHPERYGAINVLGRPRQSRAKGLARAMLETIPIVKFGDEKASDETKPGDVELAAGSHAVINNDKHAAEAGQEVSGTPMADGTTDPIAAAGASRLAADTDDENPMCSICTDDFEKGQDIRVLPCNHKFHAACVDPWLLDVSGTCPLCRVDLRGNDTDTTPSGSRTAPAFPPPVATDGAAPGRRGRIRSIFNLHSMNSLTPQERISALRQYRRENDARQ